MNDKVYAPSRPELIYERLRRDIATGALGPGPLRLRPLAERFGTSQIPVREALRRLQAEGLVTFDDNRAITVNRISREEVDEIFAIRSELEGLALRRAASKAVGNEALFAQLEGLMDRMDDEASNPDAWRTTNEEFHTTIYAAAALPRLLTIIRTLWVAVEPYLRMYVTAKRNLLEAQEQHRTIVAYLRAGKATDAEAVLREHLESTRLIVAELMAE